MTSVTGWAEAKGRIRVLHVNYSYGYGGIQEIIRVLIKFTDRYRFEHIVVAPASGPLQSEYERLGAPALVAGEDEIVHLAEKYRVDLVLTHTVNGTNPWAHRHIYQLQEKGVPVVAYLHCSFLCQSPIEMFRAVITESESNWRLLGKPAIEIIPHGIDTSVQPTVEPAITRTRLGIEEDALVIGRISRLEDSKLISETIKAMARLKQRVKQPLAFVIAGGEADYVEFELGKGNYLDGLQTLARSLGLEEQEMIFTGPITPGEKANLLATLEVYLAPSSMEGYGLVFCEAMSNGIPIVTYDQLANRETVGEGGIVVEFGNLEGLVSATQRLAEDPHLRRQIGERGQSLVRTRNDAWHYARQVEAVLLKALLR